MVKCDKKVKKMLCYCHSKEDFSQCCEPFLKDQKKPQTPLELMRSRYSAYVLGDADYIIKTSSLQNRHEGDRELIQEYAKNVTWLQLEIIEAFDTCVEFKAYYKENATIAMQHEKSFFVCEEGVWYYKEGTLYNTKIERNIPCPCGSGKKYKKCCAKT